MTETTIDTTAAEQEPEQAVSAWAAKLTRIKTRKPLERSYTFHDEDLQDAADETLEALQRAHERARKAGLAALSGDFDAEDAAGLMNAVQAYVDADEDVVTAEANHQAAVQAAKDADEVLTLRAIGATAFEDLTASCPPTAEQAKRGEDYNVKRFAPLLIAACCTEDMTVAEAASLVGGEVEVVTPGEPAKWDKVEGVLNQGEAAMLFGLAIAVNQNARVSLGKG